MMSSEATNHSWSNTYFGGFWVHATLSHCVRVTYIPKSPLINGNLPLFSSNLFLLLMSSVLYMWSCTTGFQPLKFSQINVWIITSNKSCQDWTVFKMGGGQALVQIFSHNFWRQIISLQPLADQKCFLFMSQCLCFFKSVQQQHWPKPFWNSSTCKTVFDALSIFNRFMIWFGLSFPSLLCNIVPTLAI